MFIYDEHIRRRRILWTELVFTNVTNPRSMFSRKHLTKTILKRCFVGANATILCGVTIGEAALIGAER